MRREERPAVAGRGRGGWDRPAEVGPGGEALTQRGDVDRADDAVVGARRVGAVVDGRAVAPAVRERREVAGRSVGRRRVVRVLARRHVEAAAIRIAAREDRAGDVDRSLHRVDLGEPAGAGDLGLGRQLGRARSRRIVDDRLDGPVRVRPPVAVELVEALARRVARRRHRRPEYLAVRVHLVEQIAAGPVGARAVRQRRRRAGRLVRRARRGAGEIDVVGLRRPVDASRGEELADLVRSDRAPVAADQLALGAVRIGIESAGVRGVQRGAVDQPRVAGGEADRVRRAGGARDRDRDLGAEVGAAVEGEIRLVRDRAVAVGDRVGDDHVRQARRPVVVLGRLVGGRGQHGDAVAVGVVDGLPGEARVVERAERLLDDLDVVVGGVGDGGAEPVDVGDEAVADAQVDGHAVRAGADVAAVVGLRGRVPRLAGPVAVLDVVERVVVVVEEVPADEVVDVAVAVVVDPVAERDQQVLRLEHPRRPDALRRVRLDPVVAGVVDQVEDAVAVQVPLAGVAVGTAAAAILAGLVRRREPVVARLRRLAGADPRLLAEIAHRAGVVPLDPRVEDRDRHVGTAGRRPEGGLGSGIGVDDVGAADAAELDRARIVGRVRRIGGRRELEGVAAEVARHLAGVQPEVVVAGRGRVAAVGELGCGARCEQCRRRERGERNGRCPQPGAANARTDRSSLSQGRSSLPRDGSAGAGPGVTRRSGIRGAASGRDRGSPCRSRAGASSWRACGAARRS